MVAKRRQVEGEERRVAVRRVAVRRAARRRR